jgi:hypothetical protein
MPSTLLCIRCALSVDLSLKSSSRLLSRTHVWLTAVRLSSAAKDVGLKKHAMTKSKVGNMDEM